MKCLGRMITGTRLRQKRNKLFLKMPQKKSLTINMFQTSECCIRQSFTVKCRMSPCDEVEIGMWLSPRTSAHPKTTMELIRKPLETRSEFQPLANQVSISSLKSSLTQVHNREMIMLKLFQSLLNIPPFPNVVEKRKLETGASSKEHETYSPSYVFIPTCIKF